MATNKNALIRYRIIDSCLTSKHKKHWSIPEFIEKIAEQDTMVEKRTIEQDLQAMRNDERLNFNAPIAYCHINRGYYYTDPNYTIGTVPLTNDDFDLLTLAINILQQYMGTPIAAQFKGVVDKLGKVLSHLKRPDKHNIIDFEGSPFYKGHDFFEPVYQAADKKQPVHITYKKFDDAEEREHVFHPYFMKEFRNRWYVLGYSEARHFIITLALDRIIKLKEANIAFKENKKLKPKEYFKHTLGITLGKGPVEDIELWFSPTMAPYIKTQHLHHTQKTVREDNDGLTINLKLIPNPELLQLLLSYCGNVKVLAPVSLKEKYKEEIKKGMEMCG
jgi:predicted DNA-binding transcriptional regulator YafY